MTQCNYLMTSNANLKIIEMHKIYALQQCLHFYVLKIIIIWRLLVCYSTRGQYFLSTNSQRPYARGRNFTTPLILPSASQEKSEYDEDYSDEDDDYIYEYDHNIIL